jgi:hypothetical protein
VVIVAIALFMLSNAPHAQTTYMEVSLGDSFEGTIGEAGVDTVEASFAAEPGETIRLSIQAATGSTLQPTVVIRDHLGVALDSGTTQSLGWLPVGNLIHYFTVPALGMYTAEIGGSSGNGDFYATLSGSPVEIPDPETSLSGTVTDSSTAGAIAGASVIVDDVLFATTSGSGEYSGEIEPGSHDVRFTAEGYAAFSASIDISVGEAATLDASLTPLVEVSIEADVSGDEVAGGSLTATVEIVIPIGATVDSITWSQEYGVTAMIANGDTDTATVTLGSEGAYRDELIHILSEPPISEDQLPPNIPPPPEEFPGGLQDRFQVVGINPFALEETALVVLMVEVETSLGTFSDEVEIHTEIPWAVSPGLRNAPIGVPVLLHGKEQAMYDWVLNTPAGSMATLTDGSTQSPYFTPDVSGLYELGVTDEEAAATLTLQVYAGTWRGIIVDQDIEGRPVSDTACTFCHNDMFAPDKFTPWAQTGHAEILTNNLNTSTHYGPNCFGCHSVGFKPGVENGGFHDAPDYEDFLDAGLLNVPGDNWTTMLEQFPEAARLANIQCENCHGPQDSFAHGFGDPPGEPRIDLSSDVCAACHGEPLRHARFQQWQLSKHADYELAIDEGDSGSCSRCHTANGFLKWVEVLLDDDPETDPDDSVEVTWTLDEVHPQTCAACHDPHDIGTVSGNNTNANVRIEGDTPPLQSGFTVEDVGSAALCMTCHNSRRGERNDGVFDDLSANEKARSPHGPTQTDVLVGQNAYLMELPGPGGHSTLDSPCVDCHMKETEPPDELAYNQGGLNHTFFADTNICADCHSPHLLASDVQDHIEHLLGQVGELLEEHHIALIGEQTSQGYTVYFEYEDEDDVLIEVTITDVDDITDLEFTSTRGRQGIAVTLTTGGPHGPVRLQDIDVFDGATEVGSLNELADDVLLKSGWNWLLVEHDGSLGVHNPFFASDTLVASRDALIEASASRGWGRTERRPREGQPPASAERPNSRRWSSWTSRPR